MNPSPDTLFFTLAFACYLAAMALFLLRGITRRTGFGWAGVAGLVLGAALQTIALVARWKASGHLPLTQMHEYASVMSWMAAICLAILLARTRRFEVGAYATPLIIAIMAIASLLPKEINRQLVPALQSYWLYIHVSMAALAEGAFALSCALSIVYLVKARAAAAAPPAELARLDALNHRVISLAYPLFTLGALFAGAIWAYRAWGTFWSWDPKEVGSLIIWLFYTGYLHARHKHGWVGKRAAVLSIIGFAMVILSFVGNLFLGGQHAYG